MSNTDGGRIQLRNPDPAKKMPLMAQDQYELVRDTVLSVVPPEAPGITLEDYLAEMKRRLPGVAGWDPSVSANWWGMAIKLDMEARGELERINDKPPQRIVRKANLEEPMTAPEHIYEVEIATSPERLWKAITDPTDTQRYWYGALSISDWQVGSRWTSESPDGEVYLDGEILEIVPPRRLVHSFHVVHEEEAAAEAPSRIEWQITPIGDRCRLTVIHTGRGPATMEYTSGGWETILGGLKELLESGLAVAPAM